jgi:hypothetical protein
MINDKKLDMNKHLVDTLNKYEDEPDIVEQVIRNSPSPVKGYKGGSSPIQPKPLVNFSPKFYQNTKQKLSKEEVEKEKFDRHMDKEYGHEAIKKDILKQIYQNKKAGKLPYEGMSQSTIIVAEVIKDKAQKQLAKMRSKDSSITPPTTVKPVKRMLIDVSEDPELKVMRERVFNNRRVVHDVDRGGIAGLLGGVKKNQR